MNFDQLVSLCHDTHQQLVTAASRSIDTHLVARNFLFGHYIVHFEQEGSDRALYGKQTLKALSQALKSAGERGFSVDNLELMRRYLPSIPLRYSPHANVRDTVSDFAGNPVASPAQP